MVKLNAEQVAKFKAIQQETIDKLSQVVGGEVNADSPKQITAENASCLVAHSIGNVIELLKIINDGEVAE